MPVYVIVDDSDPTIVYSPRIAQTSPFTSAEAEADGWFVGGTGMLVKLFRFILTIHDTDLCSNIGVQNEFLQTTSGSGKAGSTMSFEFTGMPVAMILVTAANGWMLHL